MAKEIISESRLREIISEETVRFKKKLTLETEKKQLLKKLHEMYMEEEEMEEVVEDDVAVRPATEVDAKKFLAYIKMTPEQISAAVNEDPNAMDAIANPKAEAQQVVKVAQNLMKEYASLSEEEVDQTVKGNIGEFKIRMGKILKGLGIGGSMAGIILAGIGWAVATGAIPGGLMLANPLVYSAVLTFVLGIIGVISGSNKSKKGYLELAKSTIQNKNLLAYVEQFKQAKDIKQKGKIMNQINKFLTDIAEKAGLQGLLGADQKMGFIDSVKDMLGLPRQK